MGSLDDYTDEELGRMFRALAHSQDFARKEAVGNLDAFCSFLDAVGLGFIASIIKVSAWAWQKVRQIWRSIFD